MTEPVARVSARRTVRVAAALVAGQAVLCAVIGWVTFGKNHVQHAGSANATVEPLAGRPLVIPPPAAPRRPKPSASPRASSPSSSSSAARPTSASPRTSSSRPASSTQATPPAPRGAPAKATSVAAQPAMALPSPPAKDEVQSPVVASDRCDPVGASGLTAAGLSLRCVVGDDGTARWQPEARSATSHSPGTG